jgi:bifunctional DNase/RNase
MPHRIVLLREDEGDRVLPIWIGPLEASALALTMRNRKVERPITHDLMTTLLDLGNAKVKTASVSRLHETVYYGSMFIQLSENGEQAEVDCRVSDAINVAVRLAIPITVAPEVMDEMGESAADFEPDEQGNFTLKNSKHEGLVWRSMLA